MAVRKWTSTTLVDGTFNYDTVNKALLDLLDKVNTSYNFADSFSTTLDKGTVVRGSVDLADALTLASGTVRRIATLTIPAGRWDISGLLALDNTTASYTSIRHGMSSSSTAFVGSTGDLPDEATGVASFRPQFVAASVYAQIQTYPIPTYRVVFTAETTLYFITQCTFTAGPASAYGWVECRYIGNPS